MKRIYKKLWMTVTLFLMSATSCLTHASLIFEFDNASVPLVDFVGVEASDFGISFGPDPLDIGDRFDLLIGSTAGAGDLSSWFDVGFNQDAQYGILFGDQLHIVPTTDKFYVTIVKNSGSFNVSGVSAYFSDDGEGAQFIGVPIRQPATVPEPTSLMLLLLALLMVGVISRQDINFPTNRLFNNKNNQDFVL